MTVVLGIDPGSRITGYGVIEVNGSKSTYIDSGCIRTDTNAELPERLGQIFSGIDEIVRLFLPQEVGIEQVFMAKNADSALKLGQARGAAIVACTTHRIPVSEYSARQIKQAVVGTGAAQKEQVQLMVCHLLKLDKTPQADAADALGVALCHTHMQQSLIRMAGAQKVRRRRLR
ncbi:crossover junction endodeoxyribonuclease RuvC [Gammaproteobacteria bacterium 45_16_T64]|nr:crossover junction endodeoxyribonuclease RuvC [Gammaproteobacteria bacterium 45_16_T64]